MLKAGDYVVHSMEGVCEVKSIVEMPKGRERVSYYQLSSWPDGKTTVYVPVKQDPDRGARLRKLLSSEEMQQVFKGILHDEQEWISDIGARQEWMLGIMKEGDPYKMARMTRMLMKKDLEIQRRTTGPYWPISSRASVLQREIRSLSNRIFFIKTAFFP